MPSFLPNQVLISREALRYPLGAKLADSFREREILVNIYEQRIPTVPLRSFRERTCVPREHLSSRSGRDANFRHASLFSA